MTKCKPWSRTLWAVTLTAKHLRDRTLLGDIWDKESSKHFYPEAPKWVSP